MSARPAIDRLAVRVCHVVRDVRGEHQAWIALDRVADRLDDHGADAIDAAVAFAVAKGWLSLGGAPVHSVLLTPRAPPLSSVAAVPARRGAGIP